MKRILMVLVCIAPLLSAGPTPETERAFARYLSGREAAKDKSVNGRDFLWIDQHSDLAAEAKQGTVIQPLNRQNPLGVADGLVHDWVGTVFIPGVTLEQALAFMQNYDNHKRVFRPEVMDSKTLHHQGDNYRTYLRLRKHKLITVILNSEHDVRYTRLDAKRAASRSFSTRITEIENPDTPQEHEMAPGDDHGFLWNLNSYWRFEERDGGVWLECEAISLTRDIPFGLGPIVKPIIRDLPRESLEKALEATRRELLKAAK
jgi:hypothetical protein